jgi:CheY-like chemotaxis protein
MAIAALIIVGVLLVSGTLAAAFMVQRRGEPAGHGVAGRAHGDAERDEYAERLRKSMRSRLSHELRTPLNSIITLSQLLIEDEHAKLTPEQRRYIDVIGRNGRNLLSMLDQLGEGGSVRSQEGAGSGALPPAQRESQESRESLEAGDTSPVPVAPGFETPHAPGPILLIEDDPIERQRVGSFIEAAGYDVTRAASGEEGLALLRSRPFAAVVLDLIMPEMTGLDVLRAARTEQRLADVRFIVLSAMYMTRNERQVLGPKVTDVVRKGETMPRGLTFALRRAVRPAYGDAAHAHPGNGGRHL